MDWHEHSKSWWRSKAAGYDVCNCGQRLPAPDDGWNGPTPTVPTAPLLTRGQEARAPGTERECHDLD